jgi:hopanoid biosynthesis associated RND transporter like protein HpnN
MVADRTPQSEDAYLARPFALLTRLVVAYPATTVSLAVLLAILALVLTFDKLGYRTSRLDLLNPKSDYNRLWIEYIQEFGDDDDAVIVVEGASRDDVIPVLQEVSSALAQESHLFHAVLHEVDLSLIRSKGLHYLSFEELAGVHNFLQGLGPLVNGEADGNWWALNLGHMTRGLAKRLAQESPPPGAPPTSTEIELERLTAGLLNTLDRRSRYQSPWPEMPASFATLSDLSTEFLLTKEGRLGFVLLRIARNKDSFTGASKATNALRALIARSAARHPEVKIGLTGLPIMEDDEMRSSQSSMLWASLVSFVGVGLLFVAGFGGLRHAILANVVLLIGMAWAFGYVTLSVGHLNILSVSFSVTLIGIGIDYGIHYISRYMQLRGPIRNAGDALVATSRSISPAIWIGAVTTAISFFAAGLTSFTGVAELGIIAGGGILLCALAQLIVLPAVIQLVDRLPSAARMPTPLPMHRWIAPLMKAPRLVCALTAVATLFVATGMTRLWYDNNLLNMQAEGLESIELERKLLAETNQSCWYALSMANSREELLQRKASFLKLPSVERTEEIVSMLPADHEQKRAIIAQIGKQLSRLPERPPLIPVDRPDELGRILAGIQDYLIHAHRGQPCVRNLDQIRDILRRMAIADCYRSLSQFQQQIAGDLLSRLYTLRSMANPEPPRMTDLPASLVNRFVGQHGKYLLKIYGRGNIWDVQALGQFVKEVRSVDPRVTGNPLQAYEASLEMKHSYEMAGFYAAIVIIGLLAFDFRSLRYACLAALPLVLGMIQTFGLLGLLNIPLNPANLIALPLMLGIGVDYGIHIVHDYLDQKGRYRMSPSTAVAVVVDSLTTIVGYGALMIASHQGLQSLGRVLAIGITCCLFSSMVMLPALLTWMSWSRGAGECASTPDDDVRKLLRPLRRVDATRPPGYRPHIPLRRPAAVPQTKVA